MGFFKSLGKVIKDTTRGLGGVVADELGLGNEYDQLAMAAAAAATGGASGFAAGAIGLGTDMLQSYYNTQMQKDLAKYNAEQQQAINDRTYQQNLEMWNLKNAYDSPAAQMERFAAAGLNKNLIYGQSNTSGSAPTLESAKFDTGPYNPVDTRMQRAQLQLAMLEHGQRIENQAIQNDLARQRLVLAARDADRSDALARAQINSLGVNTALKENPLTPYKNGISQDFNNWYDRYVDNVSNWLYDRIGSDGLFHTKEVAQRSWKK